MQAFIRAIIMVLGYIYPAYECFKSLEKGPPDVDNLQFWCQYWMIIAIMTVTEKLGYTLISWLPFYSEAKLAFIIYLWYPKTKGTTYVYSTFLRPLISRHESEIDRYMKELMVKAAETFLLYGESAAAFVQLKLNEFWQFLTSKSEFPNGQAGLTSPPPPTFNYQSSAQLPAKSQQPFSEEKCQPVVLAKSRSLQSESKSNPGVQSHAIYRVDDISWQKVGTMQLASLPESAMPSPAAVYRMHRWQKVIYKQ